MKSLLGRGRASKAGGGDADEVVVALSVGGVVYTTTRATLCKADGSRLREMFEPDDWRKRLAKDAEGRVFIDRDGAHFGTILTFLRDGDADLPAPGSPECAALRREADHFGVFALVDKLTEHAAAAAPASGSRRKLVQSGTGAPLSTEDAERAELDDIARAKAELQARAAEVERRLEEGLRDGSIDERARDLLAVELRKLQLESDKRELQSKARGRRLRYNLLIVGVTGSGKSSSLNTLLDQNVCPVSGAQAQGTRGCVLRDITLDPSHYLSFIDTQGLGADTSISDEELLSQIIMSTESVLKLGVINNVLISFDVNSRTTPASMANQLTLMELFAELRRSCFVVFTKWNVNAVQVEWNHPLRDWTKKWKRARTVAEISEDPPSYEDMYRAYCRYVIDALANEADGGAFSKMASFLSFFEARVLWMYNLDGIQLEDKEEGALEPHVERLYTFYREKALDTLDKGSTRIVTDDLTFLREDHATMQSVAAQLIRSRDDKIRQLEAVGREGKKRKDMKRIFNDMAEDNTERIHDADFRAKSAYATRIATLAGFMRTVATAGCTVM